MELKDNDCAVIVREDMTIEVVLMDGNPDDPVPDNAMVVVALAKIAMDKEKISMAVDEVIDAAGAYEADRKE